MALNCPKCGGLLASGPGAEDELECARCSTAVFLPAIRTTPPAGRAVPRAFDPRAFLASPDERSRASAAPMFRSHRTAAPAPRALSPMLFILLATGTAILFLGSALLFRAPFVEARPGPESFFGAPAPRLDSRALVMRNVAASRIVVGERPILIVGGEIANTGFRELVVPAIRVGLNDEGSEIFAWTIDPEQSTLAAGATLRFKSRVAAPAGAGNLELSFVAPE